MCLFLNNVHNKLQSKFRLEVTHACHVNKFHATKTKNSVGSHQTILFSGQWKARILWVNCTDLTIFALNYPLLRCVYKKTALLLANQNLVICYVYHKVGNERTASTILRECQLLVTKKFSFSLGNCHPMIICYDADLDEALPIAIKGR